MSFSRLRASRSIVNSALRVAVRNGGGGGHHGPSTPPFARNAPPAGKLPEDFELIWDDGVAPETTIDFDANHIPTSEVIFSMLIGFGFFASIYQLVKWSDPEGRNPVVPRVETMDKEQYLYFLGLGPKEEGGASEEEEEE